MADLLVRNIEDEVKQRLRMRASRHGRSLEAEVRDILKAAALDEGKPETWRGLGSEIAALFRGLDAPQPSELRTGETIRAPE